MSEKPGKALDLDAIGQAIEERDFALRQYHELANLMIYEGNSIGWWHSKAKNYGAALLDAWDALREAGVECDGATTVSQGIRILARSKHG